MRTRRGISPVIASVMLAAIVIAVGGSVWFYSISATTTVADSYVKETLDSIYKVTERYIVENIYYDNSTDVLMIWVYNYGDVKISVDTYVSVDGVEVERYFGKVIQAKKIERIDINCSPPLESVKLSVKLFSKRENHVYATYYVP